MAKTIEQDNATSIEFVAQKLKQESELEFDRVMRILMEDDTDA